VRGLGAGDRIRLGGVRAPDGGGRAGAVDDAALGGAGGEHGFVRGAVGAELAGDASALDGADALVDGAQKREVEGELTVRADAVDERIHERFPIVRGRDVGEREGEANFRFFLPLPPFFLPPVRTMAAAARAPRATMANVPMPPESAAALPPGGVMQPPAPLFAAASNCCVWGLHCLVTQVLVVRS